MLRTDILQNAPKAGGRSKELKGKNTQDNVDSFNPKEAAKKKLNDSAEAVQEGMKCARHGRLCYPKWDGKSCGAYTPTTSTSTPKCS